MSPHQCVHCGKIYPSACKEMLEGCSCGSRFFFFVREEHLKELKTEIESLTKEEKTEIEEEVRDIIGLEIYDKPIILEFENIRMLKPGKIEIDLVSLFRRKPIIYKIGEGKYIIDLPSTFKSFSKGKEDKEKTAK